MPAHASAAIDVVTSDVLFPAIGSFLRGVPVWTVEYEYKYAPRSEELTRDACAKRSMGTPGLLPRLAIERNDLRTLKRLYALHSQPQFQLKGKFWFTNAMHDAAAAGSIDALQWLHENTKETCPTTAMTIAATHGHTEAVRWLLQHRPESHNRMSTMPMALAAKNGHVAILEVLQTHSPPPCAGDVMDRAAANGHLKVVEFLHNNGHERCSTVAADDAATHGHLDVLKFLLTTWDGRFTEDAAYGAVVNGHLGIVEYLLEAAGPGSSTKADAVKRGMRKAIPKALAGGSVDMLAFLYKLMPEAFPRFAMAQAVAPGRLAIVQFLYSTGRAQEDIDQALQAAKKRDANDIADYLRSVCISTATPQDTCLSPAPATASVQA